MFFPEGQLRVYLYGEPTDMRRSFDGLSAMVRQKLLADPLDGGVYAFINHLAGALDACAPVLPAAAARWLR